MATSQRTDMPALPEPAADDPPSDSAPTLDAFAATHGTTEDARTDVTLSPPAIVEHRYVERGHQPARIAAAFADADADSVRDTLRDRDVLAPWDDPRALARLFIDDDRSCGWIAREVADGAITSETVRNRVHRFGLIDPLDERHPEHRTNRLEALDPEDVGLSPLSGEGDRDEKYERRGGARTDV